jgi:two-component system nitrate/nitrite response regulator NarL
MKLLLVDDHPLVAQGLSAVLQHEPEFELAGFATTGKEALAHYEIVKPDMLLVDLRLPGESGLDVIRTLRKKYPDAKCVVLTSSSAAHEVKEAIGLGVDGYVLKDALPEELLEALKRIAVGRKYYDAKAMEVFVEIGVSGAALLKELTEREIEVLKELAAGRSNKQIAGKLWIADSTVKKHISAILAKLNLTDRTQAALFAVEHGLGANANGHG